MRKDDERIKASYETVPSPDGNGYIRGYFVRPFSADTRDATPAKLPGIIIIHENRGLNPHTEDVARRFALENFMAFAPDGLTSVGGYPGDDYKGGQLFAKIDKAKMTQDFLAAARWLKARPDCTGKIGATGFCFGGGMANTLAVLMGPDLAAAAPFYGAGAQAGRRGQDQGGHPDQPWRAGQAGGGRLAGPGSRAQEDTTSAMKAISGPIPCMASSTTPRRNATTRSRRQQAWTRTIEWFNQYVRNAPA